MNLAFCAMGSVFSFLLLMFVMVASAFSEAVALKEFVMFAMKFNMASKIFPLLNEKRR
jgi:hypothetical protein